MKRYISTIMYILLLYLLRTCCAYFALYLLCYFLDSCRHLLMADDSFEKVENFHLVLFLSRLLKERWIILTSKVINRRLWPVTVNQCFIIMQNLWHLMAFRAPDQWVVTRVVWKLRKHRDSIKGCNKLGLSVEDVANGILRLRDNSVRRKTTNDLVAQHTAHMRSAIPPSWALCSCAAFTLSVRPFHFS